MPNAPLKQFSQQERDATARAREFEQRQQQEAERNRQLAEQMQRQQQEAERKKMAEQMQRQQEACCLASHLSSGSTLFCRKRLDRKSTANKRRISNNSR